MNKKQYNDLIGKKGESIIFNLLECCRRKPEYSRNPFDAEKDIICQGHLKVEIKTEQPYVMKNCLSFSINQLNKCKSCDELYFVSIPPLIDINYKYGGKIYRIIPSLFEYFEYATSTGKKMFGVPFEQPTVIEIAVLSEKVKQWFIDNAQSNYYNGKKMT